MEKLAENVYAIADTKPTKDDSDANGNVLYFSATLGWHQGYWSLPWREDITHWTYLPERPPSLPDPKVIRDQAFKDWLAKFPTKFEEPAISLLRLGFNGGWNQGKR